jgi:DNA-binding NtrC family response regulator
VAVEVVDAASATPAQRATGERVAVGTAVGNDLVLADPTVSRFHVSFERAAEGVLVIDRGSTNGTWLGPVRVTRAVVPPGTELTLGRTVVRVLDGAPSDVDVLLADSLAGIRGRSAAMRRLMADVQRAASSTASVLVVGESGTGKELIARALHELSPRRAGPFVTVDCASLPPTLINGELFGHERGSFTGADRRYAGAFERAHGGTVFLDEVGELPPPQQASLLGVLERRRFRRVGGTQEVSVDVRVVSATNRDLCARVNDSAFRLDLFHRLAVVTLRPPPLRERLEDLPILVEHLLAQLGYSGPLEAVLPASAMKALGAYAFPGNVRELRNIVEAALVMGPPSLVEPTAAEPSADPVAQAEEGAGGETVPYRVARSATLDDFERRYLQQLMARTRNNAAQAAREAQMDRSYLLELLRKHGLR